MIKLLINLGEITLLDIIRKEVFKMQLLTELLVILDNMECSTCKLKDQCNEMKEKKNVTLCKYLFKKKKKYFWNKNNK